MPMVDVNSVKLIQELRLRKWARAHYVPPEQRGKNWHPIVLQEMGFRDAELAEQAAALDDRGSSFVPLAPTETFYIDTPHPAVPAPKSLLMPADQERIETYHG